MNQSTPSSVPPTQAKSPNPEPRLRAVGAIVGALLGGKLEHYPCFPQADGHWVKTPDSEVIERVAAGLKNLNVEDEKLKDALERGRESLDEVKELTEYQDQKATRLLTIITFLSALSGILFARFVESYPLHSTLARTDPVSWGLVVTSYASFGFFALLAICGALVVFHATRTRFRYPDTKAGTREKAGSYLFYKSIIEVTPEAWARSFVADANNERVTPDLQIQYFRNYVIESYLVAAKVADKLRYLEPAQVILSWSIRVLLFWLVFVAATITFVPAKGQTLNSAPSAPIAGSSACAAPPAPEKAEPAYTGAPTR